MNKNSPYAQISIVLTTKHEKSIVIAPSFLNVLSAEIVEYVFDTDQLGTFSGEIERKGTALDCAKIKCELGLNLTSSLLCAKCQCQGWGKVDVERGVRI